MITLMPIGPEVGLMLVMLAGGVTVKVTPLLITPPTVTITFPVVAPDGTVTSKLDGDQFAVPVAWKLLKVTVLLP
jgi:hypothetical protein